MYLRLIGWICAGLFFSLSFPSQAAPEKTSLSVIEKASEPLDSYDIFTAVWENDIVANTDSNYTNGIRLAWLSSEENPTAWMRWITDRFPILEPNGRRRISAAVGQSMFTPDNLSERHLIMDDRPYASWLYGSMGVISDTGSILENAALTIGVIGPYALGKPVQRFVHKVIDSPKPLGWSNQLESEPGIVFDYERKWRGLMKYSPFGLGADVMPHIGASVGNIYTHALAGVTLRLGYDLPADYGPARIRPSLPGSDFFIPTRDLGGYLFLGAEGRAVARNIFLDGNTFRDSHSLNKEIMVGSLQGGFALTYADARLSYTHILMSREFKEQKKPAQFGALSLSWRF